MKPKKAHVSEITRIKEEYTHTPPKFQLASKSEKSEKFMKKCLRGIIFLSK